MDPTPSRPASAVIGVRRVAGVAEIGGHAEPPHWHLLEGHRIDVADIAATRVGSRFEVLPIAVGA